MSWHGAEVVVDLLCDCLNLFELFGKDLLRSSPVSELVGVAAVEEPFSF